MNDIFYSMNENDIYNYADNNTLSVAEVDIKNQRTQRVQYSTAVFLNNLHNLNGGQMSTFNC